MDYYLWNGQTKKQAMTKKPTQVFLLNKTFQPHTKTETSETARNYQNFQKLQERGWGIYYKSMYW